MHDPDRQLEDFGDALDLNLVLERTIDGVVVYDREWRIRYLNSPARALMELRGPLQCRILWEVLSLDGGYAIVAGLFSRDDSSCAPIRPR